MAQPPSPLKLHSPEQTGPPLLRRATLAISTGAGCLACTSHAKASLFFAFLPLAFSLGCCFPLALLGMEHPCIPGGLLGMGALAPSAAVSVGCWRAGDPQEGGAAAFAFLTSPAQNLCLFFFFFNY